MQIEQFVMAYNVEQDRIRAMLPAGYESLRPVLRINTEIRDGSALYVELNTPVQHESKRGWLNIVHWDSGEDNLQYIRSGQKVTISAPFLYLSYTGVGIEGGCPAEKDNDGCYYHVGDDIELRPAEAVNSNKEFCDCEFSWRFHPDDASGVSIGKTLPAYYEEPTHSYPACALSAENAAAIPCRQVLGAYIVRFER